MTGPLPSSNGPRAFRDMPPDPYWGAWATAGFGLAIIGAYLLLGVAIGVVIAMVYALVRPGNPPSALTGSLLSGEGLLVSLTTIAGAVLGVGLAAAFIASRKTLSFKEYVGLRPIRAWTVLGTVLLTGLLLALSALFDTLVKVPPSGFDEHVYRTSIWPPLLWAALVVFAPAFEETLFRGFLFEGFRRSRLGIAGTIILTALLWSGLHIQYGVYQIGTIFVLGLVLGLVKYRTNSLWGPLIIHALWNLAAVVQLAILTN